MANGYGRSADSLLDSSHRSLRPIVWGFLAIAAIFLLRLLYLQVIVADSYTAMASETRTINFEKTPHRGTIYDRNGTVLAVSVDSTTIYCNPKEVEDVDDTAGKLTSILGGEVEDYKEILTKDETTFAYIQRQADVDLAKRVKSMGLKGVYFISDSRREYPNGAIGGQVIGVCDVDGNGITGLELQYDEILKGTPGVYSAERGRDGAPIPGGVHEDVAAVHGKDIMVSLDIRLQATVEEALQGGIDKYESKKGSSIVMDAENGEIYAICSYPYLDPTNLAESTIGSDNVTAITQYFEPGSAFKSISAYAVLDEEALEPDSELFVPSKLAADEYFITDAHERGDQTMSFSQILDQSSNVGISLAVDKVGFEKLDEVIRSLKLTEKTGVDFPGEALGELDDVSQWSKVAGYNIGFGQGITVTPLQLARAYGALANNGVIASPHFLISLPETGEHKEYPTEKVLDDDVALEKLIGMMRGVVTDGTGKNADIPDFDVVGKTSTAQIAENGTYAKGRWNLCFTGFIANSNSKLVCLASVNDVIYEGNVSFIFHDIMVDAIDLYKIVPS